MGRRSLKTTKAGKFMNPTDQFRKEQRRKELKKNKKQRQVVREAVLRMKDVGQMLKEIEDIDRQELENLGQPQFNEKGLEEKKSKLHASIHRVARYYQQEEPKKAQELKLMIMESEQKRRDIAREYNSYTAARSQYSIEDIPMPDSMEGSGLNDIPMPTASGPSEEKQAGSSVPPPPPPGPPPPDLIEYNVIENSFKSVRFADQGLAKPLPSMVSEAEHKDTDVKDDSGDSDEEEEEEEEEEEGEGKIGGGDDKDPLGAPARDPPGPPPGRPPPPPPSLPQMPPPLFGQTFPPRFGMPPGPPPGAPPPRFGGAPPRPLMPPPIHSGAMLSAPPTRIRANQADSSKPESVVISAQPRLRNMAAETTKFMPTSLRVRRDQTKGTKPKLKINQDLTRQSGAGVSSAAASGGGGGNRTQGQSSAVHMQGDAYDTFMHEMQGLL